MFEPDSPKKLQIVVGEAAGAAAGAASPVPAAPSPAEAALDAPPGAAPTPGIWAHAFGEDARTRIKSPATHVFRADITRSPWTAREKGVQR